MFDERGLERNSYETSFPYHSIMRYRDTSLDVVTMLTREKKLQKEK
jgi:hypothetical protein